MRTLLIVSLLLLAGCTSADESPDGEAPLADPNDPSQKVAEKQAPDDVVPEEEETPPPGPGEGRERVHSCTVTIGNPTLSGGISTGIVDAAYQSCTLFVASDVAVVVDITPADGCTINASVDSVLQHPDRIIASCEEVGVELENSIKVRTWK